MEVDGERICGFGSCVEGFGEFFEGLGVCYWADGGVLMEQANRVFSRLYLS